MRSRCILFIVMLLLFAFSPARLSAEDSDISRITLTGLNNLYVLVENIQPHLEKFASNAGLSAGLIQKDTEKRLGSAGIRILSRNEWLQAPGRPVLYIHINTHETEKYFYAYDIKLELRQMVRLEINPKIRTLADTWSINITGVANIGNLNVIKKDADVLVERFVQAYRSVNRK